ncbi:MAG: (Fe-S)-binding protein [Candidatus Helarchaeota archaeon]
MLIEKCSLCKLCEDYCSIYLSTKKYAPYEKLFVAKQVLTESQKPEDWKTIFLCTKCEACEFVCPEEIPISKIIDEARKICVEKWGTQFPRQDLLIENIFRTGNPFGEDKPRLAWLDEPINKHSKTLLHLGCMISYRYSDIGKNIIKTLKKLNIDFTISPNERCCGYFVYNTGNHKRAFEIIKRNKKDMEKYDHIITACAGCTIFIKQFYGLKKDIRHVIEIVYEKLKNKKLEFVNPDKKVAIFHDSCHISRPFNIISQPRAILNLLGYSRDNEKLKEYNLSGKNGLCCGADGGMRIIDKQLAIEIGKDKVKEAKEKADILFTLCPFCINNFVEAANELDVNLEILDIFEELVKYLDKLD